MTTRNLTMTTLERGTTPVSRHSIQALAAQLQGTLLETGHAAYDAARPVGRCRR